MFNFKRTSLLLASLGIASVGLVSAPLSAGAASTSASSIIAASKTALGSETSAHVQVKSVDGTKTTTVSVDLGKKYGDEEIVSGSEKVSIIITPKDAYVSGNKSGLIDFMGITAAEQKKVGSAAILMTSSDSAYASFSASLTSSSFPDILPTVKEATLLTKRDSKTNGYQLQWVTAATSSSPKATSTLVVSSSSPALPIKEKVIGKDEVSTTTFSKWGKKFSVTVPTKTVAYAKVF